MEWLNENSGVIVLVTAIVTIVLVALCVVLMFDLRNKIAVQKLKFLGFYSTEVDSRKRYAQITVGNKSLNDVSIIEIGVKNGKTNFNLTALYKAKANLGQDVRIVIQQRSNLTFRLEVEELKKVLIDGKNGKKLLKTLQVYVVDITGTLYHGRTSALKCLLRDVLTQEKDGGSFSAVAAEPVSAEETAPAREEVVVSDSASAEETAAAETVAPVLETGAEAASEAAPVPPTDGETAAAESDAEE